MLEIFLIGNPLSLKITQNNKMLRNLYRLRCGRCFWGFYRKNVHTNACRILYSARDKDLPNPALPTPISKFQNEPDILQDHIKKAKSISKVLELVSIHLEVMNSKHIVTCIESIHTFAKTQNIKNDENAIQKLIHDHTFQALCGRLMKTIRFMNSSEIIIIFKTFTSLGIRSNTYVMKSVLKMLGAHLNDMDLGQLTFLNFLLTKQQHGLNSLVDGLKLALPLVLQVQIDQQLDSDDINEVVDCLHIACRTRLKPATIQKVLNAILDKTTVLSPGNATTIIFALLNLETPVDGYKALITAAYENITKNIDQLNKTQIIAISRMSKSQGFYHSPFFYAASRKAIMEKWDFVLMYDILTQFFRLKFCPSELTDQFVSTICSESEIIKGENEYSPLNCIEYLTASGYKPPHIQEAVEVLCSCEKKLNFMSEKYPHLFIKFVSSIAMFGHFPPSFLSKILNDSYLFDAWSQSKKIGRAGQFERSIFSLLWSLEVYNEEKNFKISEILIQKLTQSVYQRNLNFECPLSKFIEVGLGGSQFLISGVIAKNGQLIDHILAMRSGNYPVTLKASNFNKANERVSQQLTPLEEISLPHDAKIVAVIVANEENYCKDPEILKGWMHLKVKNLAYKNYNPVVINHTSWKELPDREKIPYLMREIKVAVEDNNLFQSSLGNQNLYNKF